MGVKLKTLITSTPLPLTALKGKTVAIDGMNMLFQILYNPYQMQQKLPDTFYLDRTLRVITHLYGWLQKAIGFYKNKILPVIVFDGKPDTTKRLITKNLAHDFLITKQNYETALTMGDRENAKRFALSRSFMFLNCVHESKKILQACGIPIIMAPEEAEAQCVALQQQGKVDYVISTDYDALLYGASHLIRQLTFSTRTRVNGKWRTVKPDLTHIDLQSNLATLRISRTQLIDLSILLGNDYYPGIAGIGPKKALSSVQHYKSLENMMKGHPQLFNNAHLNRSQVKQIRDQFLAPKVAQISHKVSIAPLQLPVLRELLLKDHSLNFARVERLLARLTKAHTTFTIIKKRALTQSQPINGVLKSPSNLNPSLPAVFDIHLQRRLDRGKKKPQPVNLSYEFSAASDLYQKPQKPKKVTK